VNKFLTVEVEHSHYTRIFSVDQANSISLSLTTLVDYQKKAEIKIFLVDDQSKDLVYTYLIDPIPRAKAGEPQILLKAEFNGKYTLKLSFSLNGSLLSQENISLRKYLKKKLVLSPWLLLVPAVLLAAGALLLIPRACGSGDLGSPGVTTQKTRTQNQQTSSPAVSRETADQGASAVSAAGTVSQSTADTADRNDGKTSGQPAEETSGSAVETPPAFYMEQTIFFSPDSTVLTKQATAVLSEAAGMLKDHEDIQVEITGHCALYGTEKGRAEISLTRAWNVLMYLRSQGWEPVNTPAVTGMGGSQPVTRDAGKQDLNRRVEIIAVRGD